MMPSSMSSAGSPPPPPLPARQINIAIIDVVTVVTFSNMLSSNLLRQLSSKAVVGRRSYAARISGTTRLSQLKTIPSWVEVSRRDAIFKAFRFQDFKQSWHFMSRVAKAAEAVRFCAPDLQPIFSSSLTSRFFFSLR
jgi:hypothetical protein